jgi:hypothetical protein
MNSRRNVRNKINDGDGNRFFSAALAKDVFLSVHFDHPLIPIRRKETHIALSVLFGCLG